MTSHFSRRQQIFLWLQSKWITVTTWKIKKISNVTLLRGRIRNSVTKCHMGEEGGLKSAKRCHALIIWPLTVDIVLKICVMSSMDDLKITSWMKNRFSGPKDPQSGSDVDHLCFFQSSKNHSKTYKTKMSNMYAIVQL